MQDNKDKDNVLTSYQILGVSPETSLGEINATYRGLIMVCHPDKNNSADSRRLGLSDSEKAIMFETIQRAYKEIISQKKETNAPDYDIRYAIDSDFLVPQNDYKDIEHRRAVHREMLSNISDDIHKVVNSTRTELLFFNKEFEKNQGLEKNIDDISNPFSHGYADKFDTRERKEDHDYIKTNKERLPVEFGYEMPLEKEMFEDSIAVYMNSFYQTGPNHHKNEITFAELGVTTETLTSFTTGHVSDLEEVLENKEHFEDSFKRNFACINNSRASRTLEDIINERKTEIDDNKSQQIKEKIDRDKELIDASEIIRQKVIKKENEAFRLLEGIVIGPEDEEEIYA